jgi:hypothetical protein
MACIGRSKYRMAASCGGDPGDRAVWSYVARVRLAAMTSCCGLLPDNEAEVRQAKMVAQDEARRIGWVLHRSVGARPTRCIGAYPLEGPMLCRSSPEKLVE